MSLRRLKRNAHRHPSFKAQKAMGEYARTMTLVRQWPFRDRLTVAWDILTGGFTLASRFLLHVKNPLYSIKTTPGKLALFIFALIGYLVYRGVHGAA